MSKVLISAHAEDVGNAVVEPGEPIPADADKNTIKRLEAEGKIADIKATKAEEG
jgi:hypothetical protein